MICNDTNTNTGLILMNPKSFELRSQPGKKKGGCGEPHHLLDWKENPLTYKVPRVLNLC